MEDVQYHTTGFAERAGRSPPGWPLDGNATVNTKAFFSSFDFFFVYRAGPNSQITTPPDGTAPFCFRRNKTAMVYVINGKVVAAEDGSTSPTEDALKWVCMNERECSFEAAGGLEDIDPTSSGRYHLYTSFACPFAHRASLVHALLGLEDHVGVSVCHPMKDNNVGWHFENDPPYNDKLFGSRTLAEVLIRANPTYTGRVTTPVLYDTKRDMIVSMDSKNIMRLFHTLFNTPGVAKRPLALSLFPAAGAMRDSIISQSEEIISHINLGVYKCAFAPDQASFEASYKRLFKALDDLEARLEKNEAADAATDDISPPPMLSPSCWTGLHGRGVLTESDVLLFPTLLRFDDVYYGLFKTNFRAVREYPALQRFVSRMYALPGVKNSIDMEYTMRSYWGSKSFSDICNPKRLVPPSQHWKRITECGEE